MPVDAYACVRLCELRMGVRVSVFVVMCECECECACVCKKKERKHEFLFSMHETLGSMCRVLVCFRDSAIEKLINLS